MIIPVNVYSRETGDPVAGIVATFAFLKRRNSDGTFTDLSSAWLDKGLGAYEFAIDDADLTPGSVVAYCLDLTDESADRYETGTVPTQADGVVCLFLFSKTTGAPITDLTPAISYYQRRETDGTLTNLIGSAPSVVDDGNLLYHFVEDTGNFPIGTSIRYRITAGSGSAAAILDGVLERTPTPGIDPTLPVVSNVAPANATQITSNTTIGFDITDPGGNLERVNVYAFYPSSGTFEVVYFGNAISGFWGARGVGFAPKYAGVRAIITDGFRFTGVIRRGGWPSLPVFITDAVDDAGNEDS